MTGVTGGSALGCDSCICIESVLECFRGIRNKSFRVLGISMGLWLYALMLKKHCSPVIARALRMPVEQRGLGITALFTFGVSGIAPSSVEFQRFGGGN